MSVASVFCGCHNKLPDWVALNKRKLIFLLYWRLEIWKQGVSRATAWEEKISLVPASGGSLVFFSLWLPPSNFCFHFTWPSPFYLCVFSPFSFFKDFLYLFLVRGRKRERERNINMRLPLTHLLLGTWPTTQACALTSMRTSDLLVCRPAINPLSHSSQGTFVYI